MNMDQDKLVVDVPTKLVSSRGPHIGSKHKSLYYRSRLKHLKDCQPGDMAWCDVPLLASEFKALKEDLGDHPDGSSEVDFNRLTLEEVSHKRGSLLSIHQYCSAGV